MNVKQLIEKLSQIPQEYNILVGDRNGDFMDIQSVEKDDYYPDILISSERKIKRRIWKPVATEKPPYNKRILVKTTNGTIGEDELICVCDHEFWIEHFLNPETIVFWTEKF